MFFLVKRLTVNTLTVKSTVFTFVPFSPVVSLYFWQSRTVKSAKIVFTTIQNSVKRAVKKLVLLLSIFAVLVFNMNQSYTLQTFTDLQAMLSCLTVTKISYNLSRFYPVEDKEL